MERMKKPPAEDPGRRKWAKWKRRLVLDFFLFLGLFAALTAVGLWFGYRHLTRDLPSLAALQNYRPANVSYFYSDDGRVIGEFFRQRRIVVPYARVPQHLVQAFLAAEDAGFFQHPGIDLLSILRAFLRNLEAGHIVQGASTITQQVTRTFLLSNEKTYSRKIREAVLAFRLEKNLTKEEILHLYLNQIYLGQGCYGVEAAAQGCFGKHVEDLSLAESALIAGLVKSPSRYSPFVNPELARRRQIYVLSRMVECGFITTAQAKEALNQPLSYQALPDPNLNVTPYFTEQVRRLVEDLVGRERLLTEGLKVYTTVDIERQKAARAAVARGLKELEQRHERKGQDCPSPLQGALVCLETSTGAVKALIGGRDFQESPYNRAVQAKRQPGSAFKPFVYAAAVEAGFTPADIVLDEPVEYKDHGRVWSPQNYDRRFAGPTTLYSGLVKSRNVVTVKLLEKVGLPAVMDCARAMGITSPLAPYRSLALGTSEVSLLEMTAAFTAFPNLGEWVAPMFIDRIEDRDGRVVWRNHPRLTRALTPETAFTVLDMLRGVVSGGTGARVSALQRPAGGKTGTTSDLADAWFVGFTPELTTGVWVGRDIREQIGPGETGGRAAAPIFLYFMEQALQGGPIRDFTRPDGVVYVDIDPDTGQPAGPETTEALRVCFKMEQLSRILSEETLSAEQNPGQPEIEHVRLIFDDSSQPTPGNVGGPAFWVSSKEQGGEDM